MQPSQMQTVLALVLGLILALAAASAVATGEVYKWLDADGNEIPEGHLNLMQAFFNPSAITDEGGIEPLLRGLSVHQMQKIDEMIVDELRNGLFGSFDLASLNIQRGRDHGLPDYNTLREYFGLEKVTSFEEINPDPNVHEALAAVYETVDDIDAWVGGLAEADKNGAQVGPLRYHIIKDQFEALRDGDRYWYAVSLSRKERKMVQRLRLSDIIRLNTDIGKEINNDVFHVDSPGRGNPFNQEKRKSRIRK